MSTYAKVSMTTYPWLKITPRGFVLLFSWVVRVGQDRFEVPDGYVTNFASVPWFARWLISPTDPVLVHASILHDWMVREFGGGPPRHSWKKSAAVMRNVMRHYAGDSKTKTFKRFLVYWAVRLYGYTR